MSDFHHISVLPEETIEALAVRPDGIYVDCTLGGAGHAGRIARQLSAKGRLIGIDQDETAIAAAKARLADAVCQVTLVRDNFRSLAGVFAPASHALFTPILSATAACSLPNKMLDEVSLPVANVPIAPTKGANSG